MIEMGVTVAIMLALMALRVPVFLAIGGAAAGFAAIWAPILRGDVLAQSFLRGLDNQAFAAIPYFFAAGAIMNAGGMSARLLELARALIAHVRGGLAHANVAASVVFAGISGSAVADAAAVGSVMIPAMERDGYPPAYAAAVTAASATIGLMIPPSIPMVIFALFTPADVTDLFVAGIVPGLLMSVLLLGASVVLAARRGYRAHPWRGMGRVWRALRASVWALLMPVLVVGGLIGGVATVNEIGALAALYAAFVTLAVYREVTPRGLLAALADAAADAARILIVIAAAGAFVWIAARVGLAREMAAAVEAAAPAPTFLLAAIAVALLLLGTVLEPVTLLIVIAPVIAPVTILAGVDVVQLGVVFVLASAIGLVTPPVGVLLFMTAAQARVPLGAVVREVAPFLAALIALLAAVVAWPALTLGLGRALGL